MINVVLSGIFYPVAILRYFERALRRNPNIDLKTMGPWTGRWIPWSGGMLLDEGIGTPPDVRFPGDQHHPVHTPIRFAEAQLAKLFPDWSPALWLQVDAGFHLLGKPRQGFNAIIGTDPHVLDYTDAREMADKFFCMQCEYKAKNDIWLPYAYDPTVHFPEPDTTKTLGGALVGIQYPQRVKLVEALRKRGFQIFADIGPSFDQYRKICTSARVGLNWSSLRDLNARVFEIAAMGIPLLTNSVPDLGTFFEAGKHIRVFTDQLSAIEQFTSLINEPAEAVQMAARALETVKFHTWDDRVEQVLEGCGLQ